MKAKASLLPVIFIVILLTLLSCKSNEDIQPKELITITEFTQYEGLGRNPDKIRVHYEDAYEGDFEIIDSEENDKLITILFDRTTFKLLEKGAYAGNNGKMWLVYGNKEVCIPLFHITDTKTKGRYAWTTSELLSAVYDYGMERGLLTEK